MARGIAAMASTCALMLASCTSPYARVGAGYMQVSLKGTAALAPTSGGAGVSGNVDLESDLGLGSEGSPYGRIEAGVGPVSAVFSGFKYSGTGSGRLNVDFGDLPAGLAVDTKVDILALKGAVTFNLIDAGPFRLSPGVGVDYFDVDMEVQSQVFSAFERISAVAPLPMIFAQADLDFDFIGATVDAGGMSIDYGDGSGTFYDIEALLRVRPIAPLEVFAGYRYIRVEGDGVADGQGFDVDFELSGWFLGGGLTF